MGKVLARRLAHSKLYPVVLAFSLLAPLPGQAGELSRNEVTTYRNAINDAARGRSAQAVTQVRRTQNEVAKDVVQWYALQQGSIPATFSTYANFIAGHPDWPRCVEIEERLQCDLLRKQAEARIATATSMGAIRSFFASNPPLTPTGAGVYAEALRDSGEDGKADAAIRRFWVNGGMTRSEQTEFFDKHRSLLTEEDREARVDRLLWDAASSTRTEGDPIRSRVKTIIPTLTNKAAQAVAIARVALQEDAPDAATRLREVPESHAGIPGLMYDRARRFASKDEERAAAQILIAHGPSTDGKASAWWKLRERVARELLADGDVTIAYRVASEHGLKPEDGVPYLTAAWTAGWIALRFKDDPAEAARHFKGMYDASTSVISKARGAYWMGRAVLAMGGQEETAKQWYAVAARQGTTFYGQLAAHELYGDVLVRPPGVSEEPSAAETAAFNSRDMVRAVRVGVEIGNHSVAKAFTNALADAAKTQADATLAVRLGAELRRPDLAAWAAKRVGRLGFEVPEEGYPTIHFSIPSRPEAALIHSITRQESTFYARARSIGANAQGYMQLLPRTAKEEADKLGVQHRPEWLMSKPDHNVLLGSSYLDRLIGSFDGSYIMGTAAYNGGPGHVRKWRDRFGAPGDAPIARARKAGEPEVWNRVDWIEMIPFPETREYVQFVLAGTEVYHAILNKGSQPARLRLQQNLMR